MIHDWTLRMRGLLASRTDDDREHARLDSTIISLPTTVATRDSLPPGETIQTTGHLLFFDGGSRSNPGPGGSGAVIVQVPPEPQLVWAALMSHTGDATTNNYAGYQGLYHGLVAARRYQWTPLEVVGDSKLIITQMRDRRRPKARSLRPLYEAARSTADDLKVGHWRHHYRSNNKMVDRAANQAMDTRSSYQTHAAHGRPELEELRQWLRNDVQLWAAASQPATSRTRMTQQQRPPSGGDQDPTGPGPPPADWPPGS